MQLPVFRYHRHVRLRRGGGAPPYKLAVILYLFRQVCQQRVVDVQDSNRSPYQDFRLGLCNSLDAAHAFQVDRADRGDNTYFRDGPIAHACYFPGPYVPISATKTFVPVAKCSFMARASPAVLLKLAGVATTVVLPAARWVTYPFVVVLP